MLFRIKTLLIFLLIQTNFCFAQPELTGTWKTIDDVTGDAKSHIEIYEEGGKFYGKVKELLLKPADTVCEKCPGEKKDKPLVGMILLRGLETYKDYYSYGRILDPENGKEYKCSVWIDEADKLVVRGYIGISALGRSQNWYRVK